MGVDLRRCVLPACVGSPCSSEDSRWESLPIVVLLYHVRGGLRAEGQALGQPVGHVTLSFTVDQDPEAILLEVDAARPHSDDVRQWLDISNVAGWLYRKGVEPNQSRRAITDGDLVGGKLAPVQIHAPPEM